MNQSVIQVPVFPLPFVILPGEERGLHVFEPRYKLLIRESLLTHRHFGIPCTSGAKMLGFGSLVRVSRVLKKYADGRMDIMAEGVGTFDLEGLMAIETREVYGTAMIAVNEEDHFPVSRAVFDRFFSVYEELTGRISERDEYDGCDLFRLAVKLPLHDSQKIALVSARTIARRERQLEKMLEYLLLVRKQEEQIRGRVFPN
ncbi:MAG: LON peptidase substrate-binding domain-containing protein [Bacteroidia bacterium]|nr:LON peptidase substrate-binding domain-containing protein [Bacteroidia bacterium]